MMVRAAAASPATSMPSVVIFGIIVIGLIGLASDLLFKWVNRRLFPWAQLGR